MNKLNLTAIIFTTNSEKILERAVKSVEQCDEIVVFDIGSTDGTIAKAKKMTKNVVSVPFVPYVEPMRAEALKHATNEWVFYLDADEEAPQNLSQLFDSLQKSEYAAANVPRKNLYFNAWIKHSDYWPDYNIRLFIKNKITWYAQIHKDPTVEGKVLDIPPKEENAIIHHHYVSVSEWIGKMDRYTSVKAEEIRSEPFNWTQFFTKPLAEFLRKYFYWEGYKDGVHGLAIALLDAFYALVVVLKHWETTGFEEPQEPVSLQEVQKQVGFMRRELSYWFGDAAIKSAKGEGEKLVLKIKRKLGSL